MHCAAIGTTLGDMHREGREFPLRRENDTGLDWLGDRIQALSPLLPQEQRDLLVTEFDYQTTNPMPPLPEGVIHGDLFKDNALFLGDRMSGIIDFYTACNDRLLFDLAVTVNDWCVDGKGELLLPQTRALVSAYHAKRPLCEVEHRAWARMLRLAALRYWVGRLQEKYFPRPGEMALIKDPDEFQRILLCRRKAVPAISTLGV